MLTLCNPQRHPWIFLTLLFLFLLLCKLVSTIRPLLWPNLKKENAFFKNETKEFSFTSPSNMDWHADLFSICICLCSTLLIPHLFLRRNYLTNFFLFRLSRNCIDDIIFRKLLVFLNGLIACYYFNIFHFKIIKN